MLVLDKGSHTWSLELFYSLSPTLVSQIGYTNFILLTNMSQIQWQIKKLHKSLFQLHNISQNMSHYFSSHL